MTIKLSRSNGAYKATVSNPGNGFKRHGSFKSPGDAFDAIRLWRGQANGT